MVPETGNVHRAIFVIYRIAPTAERRRRRLGKVYYPKPVHVSGDISQTARNINSLCRPRQTPVDALLNRIRRI
jgi:ribosomal protein S7